MIHWKQGIELLSSYSTDKKKKGRKRKQLNYYVVLYEEIYNV